MSPNPGTHLGPYEILTPMFRQKPRAGRARERIVLCPRKMAGNRDWQQLPTDKWQARNKSSDTYPLFDACFGCREEMSKIILEVLMRTRFVPLAIATAALCSPLAAQKLQYPETRRMDHADTYFGVQVADPYRWLEDENAPETAKWVESENRVTFSYLEKIPYREKVKARLEKLFNYPKYGAPIRNGDYFFFSKNDGLQNQSVYYMQKGLEGTPEVLLDPNGFSADGTSPLAGFELSKNGK